MKWLSIGQCHAMPNNPIYTGVAASRVSLAPESIRKIVGRLIEVFVSGDVRETLKVFVQEYVQGRWM